jgi:hypothetical protein
MRVYLDSCIVNDARITGAGAGRIGVLVPAEFG